jgi:hypothetical protein
MNVALSTAIELAPACLAVVYHYPFGAPPLLPRRLQLCGPGIIHDADPRRSERAHLLALYQMVLQRPFELSPETGKLPLLKSNSAATPAAPPPAATRRAGTSL